MKTAGIIRIIVGLVIAVLLTAILVALLTGNNILSRAGINGDWVNDVIDRTVYRSGGVDEDSGTVVVSDEARVSADGISKIKIDWVAGSVNVRVGTGDEIVFSESSYRELSDRQRMRYTVSDSGVLQLHFCQDLENIFDWFKLDANMPAKTLTMEVPASLIGQMDDFVIESVSAGVDVSGVYGVKTDLSTVSGAIHCTDVENEQLVLSSTSGAIVSESNTTQKLNMDNVSGSIRAVGEYGKVDVETVSGSINLAFATMPDDLKAESVSGSVTVALPEDANFTVRLDTVSGKLNCAFPGKVGSDLIVVGDGEAEYRFSTVSGNVNIEIN